MTVDFEECVKDSPRFRYEFAHMLFRLLNCSAIRTIEEDEL
jgi:hypothetical protein